tara:strand:- start:125 stop:853 length:729 start_codon:yes stop_codon:yes gene_type:complete
MFYSFFLILLIILSISYYFQKKNLSNFLIDIIEGFSKNFKYEYKNSKIIGLENIKEEFIKEKLIKYLNYSIFLLPLYEISEEIGENNWVKNVKLTTDYKDTLFIEIKEYRPIGIYSFNNNNFYFNSFGKIIDHIDPTSKINENLLIFQGLASTQEANKLLEILINLNIDKELKIQKIIYVEKRRWDILINNNVKLLLSEINPKKSLENFLKIKENLSETEFNNIIKFDLRNLNKTLLTNYND